ncbi:atrial natriuretic peptide receptor 1-like [Paramacrobiotus metropolitanus]|uniref:atrial natriuretic peptide receptor 1-like n=1 Tax=Paramacrobiotus metropolitanus TaxID=2943436 RepID=UPI002445EC63|nr:atrial natriuretic peptide receptor 1-like [Paramacrobiotus metropolitanus]
MEDSTTANSTFLCSILDIEIVTLAIIHPVLLGSLPYLGPAYIKGLQDIRQKYPSLNVTQTILWEKSYRSCQDLQADGVNKVTANVDKKYQRSESDPCSTTVLMWAGCSEVAEVNPIARELDLFMLTSTASNVPDLRKKRLAPTWITITVLSMSTYVNIYVNVVSMFNWTSFAIIVDNGGNPYFPQLAQSLYPQIAPGRQVHRENINTKEDVDFKKIFLHLNSLTRVFFYLGDPNGFRKLLLKATELNSTNGEHVYVIGTPFRLSSEPGYLHWKKNDEDDEVVRFAYRSVLIIEPDGSVYGQTDGSDSFSLEMRNLSKTKYNYTYGPYELISPHPASTYAGMMMLAQVMENLRSTNACEMWSSGRETAKLFLNRSFETDVGRFYIGPLGERIPTVQVNQLDWNTSQIRPLFVQDPADLRLHAVNPPQWPGTWPPLNEPKCGFRGDAPLCTPKGNTDLYIGSGGGAVALIILLTCVVFMFTRRTANNALLNNDSWRIDSTNLRAVGDTNQVSVPKTLSEIIGNEKNVTMKYVNDQLVWVTAATKLSIPSTIQAFRPSPSALLLINHLRRLDHPNVNRFLGLTVSHSGWHVSFVSDFVQRGALTKLLPQVTLDSDLQIALIFDILKGVRAIVQSAIRYHGNLSSNCCYVDKHFTVKIGEAGFNQLRKLIRQESTDTTDDRNRDIRAVGIILLYVITVDDRFASLEKFESAPDKPSPDSFSPEFSKVVPILKLSAEGSPATATSDVNSLTRKVTVALGLSGGRIDDTHLLERIIRRLENYTTELDHQVAVRTTALIDEQRKCDLLLREMLPAKHIELLRKGTVPEPETFDLATILFTEIGGFKEIVKNSKPAFVMLFLNDVYTAFDSVLSRFDVYKVETIKDSYMVVSGIPMRNGHAHGKEICELALSLLDVYSAFGVLFDGTSLQSGIHTGSCAAGVVGLKAPRYCLFGDTVNTASRMLMYSDVSRIHISESTCTLLKEYFPELETEKRGTIEIKGKGSITTYWLAAEPLSMTARKLN